MPNSNCDKVSAQILRSLERDHNWSAAAAGVYQGVSFAGAGARLVLLVSTVECFTIFAHVDDG